MTSTSFAFGLSFTCLLVVPLASCSTPNSETVSPRPAVRTEPAPPAAATPTPAAPEASEKAPEAAAAMPVEAPAASSTEASPEASESPEAQPAAEVTATDTKPVAEATAIVVTPAPTTPTPIQPLRPEAQQSQGVGPTIGISKPAVEDTKTSVFGEPLYVNGKRVTDNQIKLYLCYGPGRALFDLARNGVVIDDELHRQAADATDAEIKRRETEKPFGSPDARKEAWDGELKIQVQQLKEKYTVADAEVQKEVDRMVNDFKKNYPALDLDTEVNRSFRNKDWYHSQLRQTQLFDKGF